MSDKSRGDNVVYVDFTVKKRKEGIESGERDMSHEVQKRELVNLDTLLMAISAVEGDIDYAKDIRDALVAKDEKIFVLLCDKDGKEMAEWGKLFGDFDGAIKNKDAESLEVAVEKIKKFIFKIKNKFE